QTRAGERERTLQRSWSMTTRSRFIGIAAIVTGRRFSFAPRKLCELKQMGVTCFDQNNQPVLPPLKILERPYSSERQKNKARRPVSR
ncbi:hypothetical protein, partial [Caballeronia terrestris]|uniref:hypothetical protein n=1 Tax=Caballeronia terrestris TaxID=1226301 RepID=UPI001F199B6E